MDISHLLSFLLNEGGSNTFYIFSNTDDKRWLMPAKNMRTAINLYQPSGIKGKALKTLFPWLHRIGFVQRAVHTTKINLALVPDLKETLCRLFEVNDLEFALFCGTPCVHQKLTMQISQGEHILGYAKFTDCEEIGGIFDHEKNTLNYLWQKGIKTVPQCLYSGKWKERIRMFVQTTTKTRKSTTDHSWGERESAFIEELYEKTVQILPFKETEFYRDLCFLCEEVNYLQGIDTKPIKDGLSQVLNDYAGLEVVFSFYHADFTPWNIYVEQRRLYAFDFEYAKRTYPPYLDYYHFFTQTAIFEKHLDAEGIWNLFQGEKKQAQRFFEHPDFAYLCYLLGIIAYYVKREKGVFTGGVKQNMKLWMELIKKILNDNKYK